MTRTIKIAVKDFCQGFFLEVDFLGERTPMPNEGDRYRAVYVHIGIDWNGYFTLRELSLFLFAPMDVESINSSFESIYKIYYVCLLLKGRESGLDSNINYIYIFSL